MLHQDLPINERIFIGKKFKFLVLNRSEIKGFFPNESCLVISVTDPETDDAEIFYSPNLLGILRLKFHDIDKSKQFKFSFQELTDVYMTSEDADKILSFLKRYLSKVKLIICQCEQGLSRSPAIAGALAKILENENDYFLQNYWANRWVYNLILEQNQKNQCK